MHKLARRPTALRTMSQNTRRNLSETAKRREADSSDPSVVPMLRFEASLPKLPVNTLDETAAKWLESVRFCVSDPKPGAPVASDSHPTPAYQRAQQSAKDLATSPIAKELQARLEARAETCDNWLSEWWNHDAYFSVRDPLCSANYFYAHADDKYRKTASKRAASLVRALLQFRSMVVNGVLEPEMVRTTPLAMASYEYLFNACRYPAKDCDYSKAFDPKQNNHIVVIRRNKFYEVSVQDAHGNSLSAADLEAQFDKIIDMAGTEDDPHPIGALTTDNRDAWAQAREHLIKAASDNASKLERIESAIVIVALDAVKPTTRDQVSWNLWIGDNHFNRWMDKHELIVTDNGKSGFNGEHGNLDGTPTSRLNDWMLRVLSANKLDLGSPTVQQSLPPPKYIAFQLDQQVKRDIDASKQAYAKIRQEHEMVVLHYEGYGKNLIKKFKTSPDSWAQLIMQLAYYKMEGKLAGTYESAQTRKFKLGRTEVIRSATADALEWVKAMEDVEVSDTRKIELFRKAANAHIKYAQMAAEGKGVDRHLYGLSKLAKPGEPLPLIFDDPAFKTSKHWILSTSQLSSEFFSSWGFQQVVDDGFGLGYSVNNESLRWCICTKTGQAKTLAHHLQEAATEVRTVMEHVIAEEAGSVRSKL